MGGGSSSLGYPQDDVRGKGPNASAPQILHDQPAPRPAPQPLSRSWSLFAPFCVPILTPPTRPATAATSRLITICTMSLAKLTIGRSHPNTKSYPHRGPSPAAPFGLTSHHHLPPFPFRRTHAQPYHPYTYPPCPSPPPPTTATATSDPFRRDLRWLPNVASAWAAVQVHDLP